MKYILYLVFAFIYLQASSSEERQTTQRDILGKYFESAFLVEIYRFYEFKNDEKSEKIETPICSGTLISPTQLVTSASCVSTKGFIFETSLRNLAIKKNDKFYKIKHIYRHNYYAELENNMAILELSDSIILPKYPKLALKKTIEDIIKDNGKVHLITQSEVSANIQAVSIISHTDCSESLEYNLPDSVVCIKSVAKSILICPEFRGSPITRVDENQNIEIIGIIPNLSSFSECQNLPLFPITNISSVSYFLESVNDKSYISEGPITQGIINDLAKGWHFLGTEDSIDTHLMYMFEEAKTIILFDNKTNSYLSWKNKNNKWDKDIFVPARSGFWLEK